MWILASNWHANVHETWLFDAFVWFLSRHKSILIYMNEFDLDPD